MAKIPRESSGMRHVAWIKDILAAMVAHVEIDYLMTEIQKAKLAEEKALLAQRLDALIAAVTPYRAWLDGADTEIRAKQRVANYLCDAAFLDAEGAARPVRKDLDHAVPGFWGRFLSASPISRLLDLGHARTVLACESAASTLRSAPAFLGSFGAFADALDKAAALLGELNAMYDKGIAPQREPLKAAVIKAVAEAREGLEQMDGRLRSHFPQRFIDSLYPQLDRRGRVVAEPAGAPDGSGPV